MDTIKTAAAVVTGARHVRAGRNGQDAVVVVTRADVAVAVVCDGCSSGRSSEVGARLGAEMFARALVARVSELRGAEAVGARGGGLGAFEAARADLVRCVADVLERMPGDREQLVHDMFLFTIVAAVLTPEGAAVWALGDGAYAFDGITCELGPFPDNAPPYVAYDLLGDSRDATFASSDSDSIVIATDGAADLGTGLDRFLTGALLAHPDALRRQLTVLARPRERIDWDARRIVREPAVLQDDCAVAILHRGRLS